MIKIFYQLKSRKFDIIRLAGVILLFTFLLTGCIEKEISIQLPDLEGTPLAVLAVLDNGRQPSVLISKVTPLNGEALFYPITQALVVLYEDDLPIDTLINFVDFIRELSPLENSIYYSNDTLYFREGSSYHLTVEAEGYTAVVSERLIYHQVIARDVRLNKIVTDSSEFGPIGNVDVIFNTVGDLNEGEFLVQDGYEVTREHFDETFTDEQITSSIRLSQIDTDPFYLNEFRSIVGIDLPQGTYHYAYQNISLDQPRQRLNFSVTNYSRHYLTFAEAITQQDRENVGGLGTLTQRLPTNIQGGFGYFTIRDNQTIFVN